MPDGATYLVDSDAFIGWLIAADAHHAHVKEALERIQQQTGSLTTTSFVVAETATLLSRRYAQTYARRFVTFLHRTEFPVIEVMGELRQEAEDLFLTQTTEKTSLIDCANVVAVQRFNLHAILGFDHFYQRFGISVLE